MLAWLCVATFAMFAANAREVDADAIWLVDNEAPIFGIVESSGADSIRFRHTTDGTNFDTQTIERSAIETIVVNFDAPRLESLAHGDWQAWQDYAEELASQKRDPVARNLAIKLLIVVAGNSQDDQDREAALTDLIALARDDDERTRFHRLRYLETGIEEATIQTDSQTPIPNAVDRIAAAQLVQSIRLGRDVQGLSSDANLQKAVTAVEHICSWQELVQFSRSNRIGSAGIRRLVALEYELRSAKDPATAAGENETSWHQLADRIGSSSLLLPTIETVTEFDPQATRFDNGQWK